MAEDWTRSEAEAIVADYLAMLEDELNGKALSKAEHRRLLLSNLTSRNRGAIEFKHCNISAILIENGLPYIDGYKPRYNYQSLLAEVVVEQLGRLPGMMQLIASDADDSGSTEPPNIGDVLHAFVEPPKTDTSRRIARQTLRAPYELRPQLGCVNYLEREACNRVLGLAGEEFVVRVEQARLANLGKERLAARVEHVSKSRGDGLGYDILSFEQDGRERLIEVKTTKHGQDTPFFVSRNELAVSKLEQERFFLYRVFGFRREPKIFTLPGALSTTCELEPTTYRANVA